MPSAPLIYKPLMDAQIKATTIADSTVGQIGQQQLRVQIGTKPDGSRQLTAMTDAVSLLDAPAQDGLEKTINGMNSIVDGRKGVRLGEVDLATDDMFGMAVNRAEAAIARHQDVFDAVTLEDAPSKVRAITGNFQQSSDQPAIFDEGTLHVSNGLRDLLARGVAGDATVTAADAATAAMHVGRELERAVTPATDANALRQVGWLEDATASMLALWPGAVSSNAGKLGFTADAAEVDKAGAQLRAEVLAPTPTNANVALYGLLQLAGIDPDSAAQLPKAQALLQDQPLERVPDALAQSIAGQFHLAPDKVGYVAQRIVDLDGRPGNVKGLQSELQQLAAARG